MAATPGFFARKFTKRGRQRVARQNMVANGRAQDQSLFGFDTKTKGLWSGTTRNLDKDSAMDMFDATKTDGKLIGSQIADIKKMLGGQGLSRTDRARLTAEMKDLQTAGKQVGADRRIARDVMEGKKSHQVALSSGEQWANKGKAAANYMWGGNAKQIAARNGAVVGGIVGLNVGIDAIEGMGSGGGQPR